MKYFCYFDYNQCGHRERSNPPAAATKILYIAKCLSAIEPTEIVSASGVVGPEPGKARVDHITDRLSVRYFFSLGRRNKVLGKIGTAFVQLQLFLYLLFRVSKNEKIVVYHSLAYMKLVQLAKKIKRFRLLLEVEEIYADVLGDGKIRHREMEYFQCADAYLFSTKFLSEKINRGRKPEVIIHGTYQVEPDRKCNFFSDSLQDGDPRVIHCVYAGTLDPRKGGATAAAAAAEFLPAQYHIHILGFGSEKEVQNMQEAISNIASRSKARVSYDGLLSGEDYIRFIQSCDIGLSTQNPDAEFNATSFPSKILSYMANGLQVVSVRIPVIEQSAVGDMLYYYDCQTPKEIAGAILSSDGKERCEPKHAIAALSKRFQKELKEILDEM